MKTLIAFYSRTGITKKAAEEIAKQMKSDVEEIIDTKDRRGVIGYLKSGRDAMKKLLTDIKPVRFNPSDYDIVVLGSPVWAGNMAPALRTYMQNNKFKKVAFFSTMGGRGSEKMFKSMEELCQLKPVSSLILKTSEVKKEQHKEKIKEFLKNIAS